MKKNLVFKLGLFCAALVLVATCFVTNAWAKYTKSVTASDSARVAKFAFTVSEGATAFSDETAIDVFGTTLTNIRQHTDGKNLGQIDAAKLIAPGSHGDFEIELANNSEVALQFALSAVDTNAGNIPIKWSYDNWSTEHTTLDGCLFAATTEYADDWKLEVGAASETITISWKWVFEGGNDTGDTTLGEAGTAVYKVVIKATATQVQPTPVHP